MTSRQGENVQLSIDGEIDVTVMQPETEGVSNGCSAHKVSQTLVPAASRSAVTKSCTTGRLGQSVIVKRTIRERC